MDAFNQPHAKFGITFLNSKIRNVHSSLCICSPSVNIWLAAKVQSKILKLNATHGIRVLFIIPRIETESKSLPAGKFQSFGKQFCRESSDGGVVISGPPRRCIIQIKPFRPKSMRVFFRTKSN